jgi:hypothetical protein
MPLFRWGLYASLGVLARWPRRRPSIPLVQYWSGALIALFLAISLDSAVRLLTRWHLRRSLAMMSVP